MRPRRNSLGNKIWNNITEWVKDDISFTDLISYIAKNLLAIVAIMISIYALNESRRTNEITLMQIEKEETPLWNWQLVYDSTNAILREINFSSLKSSMKIQNMSIYYPTIFHIRSPRTTLDNIWNLDSLEASIYYQYSHIYATIETDDTTKYNLPKVPYNECACSNFPIVIEFKYIAGDVLKTMRGEYEINFTPYSNRVKINALNFKVNIASDETRETIQNKLDFTNYMGNSFFREPHAFSNAVDSIICQDTSLCKIAKILNPQVESHLYETLEFEDTARYDAPFDTVASHAKARKTLEIITVFADSNRYSKLLKDVSVIKNILKNYPQSLQKKFAEYYFLVSRFAPYSYSKKNVAPEMFEDPKYYQRWINSLVYAKVGLVEYIIRDQDDYYYFKTKMYLEDGKKREEIND